MTRTFSKITAILLAVMMFICSIGITANISAATSTTVDIVFVGDEADKAGFAQSIITIYPGENAATSGYYIAYYTDGSNILAGYDEIGSVAATGLKATIKIQDGRMIPVGAKGIAVFESSARFLDNPPAISSAVAKADIPASKQLTLGTPDTKFGAVSDVHMNYEGYSRGAYAKWANALAFYKNWGAEYIIVTGDMTGDRGENPDLEAQYSKYLEIANASPFPADKIYEGIGNHGNTPADAPLMDKYLGGSDEVHPYTNSPYYHVLMKGDAGERDNLYIFMAQELSAAGESSTKDNFSKAQIDWVEGLFKQYGNTETNIFVIEHAPFLNYGAGDRKNGGYTSTVRFDASFPQTMRLKEILSTYKNAIVMSGHTHVSLYDDVNYSDEYNEFARTVHVGSTCQPCGYGGSSTYTRNTDGRYEVSTTYGSEGYTVEIYDEYIVYTGYNLATGKKIPAACLIMPITPYGGAGRPVTEVLTPDKAFDGSGSADDPYIIADETDFMNLTNGFNASASATESEMYGYGKYFLQTADIDMSSVNGYAGTHANGNAKCYFAGYYNGNGHSINVDINESGQRSVFPYNYGIIYNVKITGSIVAETSAQPIRTNRGGIVNCIFELELYAEHANGICYTNYNYIYNVYTSGTVSGTTPCAAVFAVSSTDVVNLYHYYTTSAGVAVTDDYGTRSNNLSAMVSAFNDRTSSKYTAVAAKLGKCKLVSVAYENGRLVFVKGIEKIEVPAGSELFFVTHFNTTAPEGAGAIMTEAYTGGGWWIHVAFTPVEGSDAYEITAISNGVSDGKATPLAIPKGGFVWAGNYGNNYPALYEKDPVNNSWCNGLPNYVTADCNAMMQRALKWKIGDKLVFEGLDITNKIVPTDTPDIVWHNPAYVCTATYSVYEEPSIFDVNGDGAVDPFDYLMIKNIYFGKHTPTSEEEKRSDLNGDGGIDMFDYLELKAFLLKK